MADILIPHSIVFNACLKYCEARFKELSEELHTANQRSANINDLHSAIYTHQIAELVSKKEVMRRLFHTLLTDGRVRIIIDYGGKEEDIPSPKLLSDAVAKLKPGDDNEET